MKRFLFVLLLLVSGYVVSYAQNADAQLVEIIDSMHFRCVGVRYAFTEDRKSLYVDKNNNDETPTTITIMRQLNIDGKMYPVKRIGPCAFYGCRNITKVLIFDNIEIIDSSAFRWCVNLSNITISNNVKRIGPDCFRNCNNLRNFHFPKSLQFISAGAFRASGLMTIVLPDGLKDIGAYAFEGCKSLTAVRFPWGLKSIGKEAFANCWSLTSVSLYDQLRSVGEGAFLSCRSLQTIAFTKVVDSRIKTMVAADAFAECKKLTNVECNTGRTGKVKDIVFHENSFRDSGVNLESVVFGGKPVSDPNATKHKKGEPEFDEEDTSIDADNADRLRTSETVKRARKKIGVRKNTKKKKR